MRRKYRNFNFTLAILVVFIVMVFFLINLSRLGRLKIPLSNVSAFRIHPRVLNDLKNLSEKYELDFAQVLSYYCLENNFFDTKDSTFVEGKIEQVFIKNYSSIKNKYSKKNIEPYVELISSIVGEIKYFPVSLLDDSDEIPYVYSDSWGAKRKYGGERIHMGTDIMDRENIRGQLPIYSMTDGVIENLGWNEKGGWRIGIRTGNDNYYYYAHFDRYADSISEGMKITAGTLLGYMGDTGYGKKEGTRGKFAVHLHIGIMPSTQLTKKEFWINPYPFLRIVDTNSI